MQIIRDLVTDTIAKMGLPKVDFAVEHPKDESHGDYSVNVAMILFGQQTNKPTNQQTKFKSPREVAEGIVKQLTANGQQLTGILEKVEVAGPGFINFYLKKDFFVRELEQAKDPGYGRNDSLLGQKTFVEFTDPNPFKEFHIGHLMSNTIGESLARILEANGATIKRANYQGDVGLHVAKSIWGWQKKMQDEGKKLSDLQGDSLKVRVEYLGQAYAYGATKYEAGETVKTEIQALNKEIYDGLAKKGTGPADTVLVGSVMELYRLGREWSLEYFETIYQRLGTKFDEYFFESEAGPVGLKVVEEGLTKGVLSVGESGAVVFKGEQYGLHTRVFRNQLGLPTYEAKDLGLAKTKWERWQYDRSYIITANEIDEYFKVLIKTLSLLYPDLAKRTTHLSHGMMKLTSGKMSSRTGKVITGEGLLNELQEVVLAKMGDPSSPKATTRQGREMENKEKVADQVAVGALKYTVLKQAIGGDITYEPEKMTNMEGATGPFIQYTHARARSILRKFEINPTRFRTLLESLQGSEPCKEEMAILRWIYRYPEVVVEAGEKHAPHLLATYLYELASRFNTFYQTCRVEEKGEVNALRYELSGAVASVLEQGLGLLGIYAPSEM